MMVGKYNMYGVDYGIEENYKFEVILPTVGFAKFKHCLENIAQKYGYTLKDVSIHQEAHGSTDYFFSLSKKRGNSIIANRIVRLSLRCANCLPVKWRW